MHTQTDNWVRYGLLAAIGLSLAAGVITLLMLTSGIDTPAMWAMGALIVLLAVGLAVTTRLRARSIARRNVELEALVAVRTSEIERRRQIAEGLREILVNLNSNRSLSESLQFIVDQAAALTDASDAIILSTTATTAVPFDIVATNRGGHISHTPGEPLLALLRPWVNGALRDREPLVWPETAPLSVPLRALIGIPLLVGDTLFGGLVLFYKEPREFSSDDLDLGFTFADQAALAIANDALRQQAEATAVAAERNRLARDLHDAVTQTLFSASLLAETLPHVWQTDPVQGEAQLRQLRQLTRGAQAEMRTLLVELRPTALAETPLPDLLRQLGEALTGRTGVRVELIHQGRCVLPKPVHVAYYRIAQEALNNVMKHAAAAAVTLTLQCRPDGGVQMLVADNGRGFDPVRVPAEHLGLAIMHERAAAVDAQLELDSRPGAGTTVELTWNGQGVREEMPAVVASGA